MSASLTCEFGGIGTGPQTPAPPFLTFVCSLAAALLSPRYLLATSLYAGPTTFLSIAWHAGMQLFFVSRSVPASASAADATDADIRPISTALFLIVDLVTLKVE